jgi:Zn-dependent peptidase ImmA (M78 family)/transcriptional regulator with XRE-family HTH domain
MTNYAGLENGDSAAVLAVRLRAARESKGLTQVQAASELGVSRPLLIAIEKGTRDPSPEEIVRLAEIYGKPVGELLRSAPPPVAIGARFRAALASGTDAEELSGAVSQLEREADNYIDLLQRASTQAPGRYPPTRSISHLDPWQAGEDLATEERNRLGIGDGPIRQLREVLEIEVGLRVFLLTLPRQVAGLFVYVDELGGCMGVNINHPSERRHWTMAHEYAHYLATRDRAEITPVSHRRQPPETERFADAFAANFLMPRSGLSRRFHELKRSKEGKVMPATLVQLAHAYGVSVQALTLRLEDLRLIGPGTWDRLLDNDFQPRAAARLLGLGSAERSAEALPLHYRLLAVQLYADGEITESQLARYLGTDIVGARRAYQKLTETGDVADDGSPQIVDLAEAAG